MVTGPSPVVLALTDHNWQIQYMNADADLLGAKGAELRGFPLIGLVHPSVASEFVAAVSRAAADRLASTLLVRMRAGADRWATATASWSPFASTSHPALELSSAKAPRRLGESPADSFIGTSQLRHRSPGDASSGRPARPRPSPRGSELSARQSEILARLVAGERVAEIARSMFLGASTVRNHLWVTYKKFGVRSQAELLAILLRSVVGE